ncbi:hypothetical protein EOV40_006755 [Acetobacter oryzoeni]|uniref:Uncharacterized protein n=1 Tax=Acetobacter oryzoeni TaxID=2500548 RepID=A0A5B9GIW5_9PROT|nr:hypothetical protein EOV40_006755 [Acetobacter oryzoeni]
MPSQRPMALHNTKGRNIVTLLSCFSREFVENVTNCLTHETVGETDCSMEAKIALPDIFRQMHHSSALQNTSLKIRKILRLYLPYSYHLCI